MWRENGRPLDPNDPQNRPAINPHMGHRARDPGWGIDPWLDEPLPPGTCRLNQPQRNNFNAFRNYEQQQQRQDNVRQNVNQRQQRQQQMEDVQNIRALQELQQLAPGNLQQRFIQARQAPQFANREPWRNPFEFEEELDVFPNANDAPLRFDVDEIEDLQFGVMKQSALPQLLDKRVRQQPVALPSSLKHWFEACKSGGVQYVRDMMKDFNNQFNPETGWSGIHYAVFYNQQQIVQMLISKEWMNLTKKDRYMTDKIKPLNIPKQSDIITLLILINNQKMLETVVQMLDFDNNLVRNFRVLIMQGICRDIALQIANPTAILFQEMLDNMDKPKFMEQKEGGIIKRGRQVLRKFQNFVSFISTNQYKIEDLEHKKVVYEGKLTENLCLTTMPYGRQSKNQLFLFDINQQGLIEAFGRFKDFVDITKMEGIGMIRGYFIDENCFVSDTQVVRIGSFLGSKLIGRGKIKSDQGKLISGEFLMDLLHGYGEITLFSSVLQGIFEEGKLEGFGVNQQKQDNHLVKRVGFFKCGESFGLSYKYDTETKTIQSSGKHKFGKLDGWGTGLVEGIFAKGCAVQSSII